MAGYELDWISKIAEDLLFRMSQKAKQSKVCFCIGSTDVNTLLSALGAKTFLAIPLK